MQNKFKLNTIVSFIIVILFFGIVFGGFILQDKITNGKVKISRAEAEAIAGPILHKCWDKPDNKIVSYSTTFINEERLDGYEGDIFYRVGGNYIKDGFPLYENTERGNVPEVFIYAETGDVVNVHVGEVGIEECPFAVEALTPPEDRYKLNYTEYTLWKWGPDRDPYTFKLPPGWGATSVDGGVASMLIVGPGVHFSNHDNALPIIFRNRPCEAVDFEDESKGEICITKQEFMSKGEILSQENIVFLNRNGVKQTVEIDGRKYLYYYLEGLEDFNRLIVPLDVPNSEIIVSILESMNFDPTEAELSTAKNTP